MLQSDIKTDNNNNFLKSKDNDIELFTSKNVNIIALRNLLNATKDTFLNSGASFDIVNKFVTTKAMELKLNPLHVLLVKKDFIAGRINITIKIEASDE